MRTILLVALTAFLSLTAAGLGVAGCLPVTGDRILARDLAMAIPAFAILPESTVIGFAPLAGVTRTFASAELSRIAKQHKLEVGDVADTCFQIPQIGQMAPDDVLAVMKRVLPADADVRIVELQKSSVPVGAMVFAREALEPAGPEGVQLWRGYIRYAGTRRLPVWARVKLMATMTSVVPVRDIPANMPVSADAIRLESKTGPIAGDKMATRLDQVQGRVLRRGVKAGERIALAWISVPPAVRRGDAVKVEVQSGEARLQFDAIAERDAKEGEQVELRNPLSGKTFRARLEGPARAVVLVGAGMRL